MTEAKMDVKADTRRMLDDAIEVYGNAIRSFKQEDTEDAYANLWDAIDLHIDTAVAEARKPLVAALEVALAHVTELRDAWKRGVLIASAGGGSRSNRNAAVEMKIRAALADAKGETG